MTDRAHHKNTNIIRITVVEALSENPDENLKSGSQSMNEGKSEPTLLDVDISSLIIEDQLERKKRRRFKFMVCFYAIQAINRMKRLRQQREELKRSLLKKLNHGVKDLYKFKVRKHKILKVMKSEMRNRFDVHLRRVKCQEECRKVQNEDLKAYMEEHNADYEEFKK